MKKIAALVAIITLFFSVIVAAPASAQSFASSTDERIERVANELARQLREQGFNVAIALPTGIIAVGDRIIVLSYYFESEGMYPGKQYVESFVKFELTLHYPGRPSQRFQTENTFEATLLTDTRWHEAIRRMVGLTLALLVPELR